CFLCEQFTLSRAKLRQPVTTSTLVGADLAQSGRNRERGSATGDNEIVTLIRNFLPRQYRRCALKLEQRLQICVIEVGWHELNRANELRDDVIDHSVIGDLDFLSGNRLFDLEPVLGHNGVKR